HGQRGSPPRDQIINRAQEQKQLRIMQRREEEGAIRRSAMPAGGAESYNRTAGGSGGDSEGALGTFGGGGIPEEELFAPLQQMSIRSTDAPVSIPTAQHGSGHKAGRGLNDRDRRAGGSGSGIGSGNSGGNGNGGGRGRFDRPPDHPSRGYRRDSEFDGNSNDSGHGQGRGQGW
ncbi:unnamed protein product, partial [Sphacelaria rigidula]